MGDGEPWAQLFLPALFLEPVRTAASFAAVRTACLQPARPAPARGRSHLFWPRRMAFSSLPYLFLIHLMPWSWASTMSGQRSVLHRMVAFSVDMRSLGRPWLFQVATSASSVSRLKGSRPLVMGMGTCPGTKVTRCPGDPCGRPSGQAGVPSRASCL